MNNTIPNFTLNDGQEIPAVGLGTYKLKGEAGVQSLITGINAGYRLLDSAYNYENEGTVGEAVKRTHIPREELLITSKLPGRYQEFGLALSTVQESLFRAGLDYYDFYLIHWPNPQQDQYIGAWQALIEAKKRGYVRSIGVCNFLPEHLDRIEKETGVKPVLNQIELHPYFNQEKQRHWHNEHQILTQSWSPLLRGNEIFNHEAITRIASQHHKKPSQVILRWHYQLNAIAIPKSGNAERQVENISIFDFELSEANMEAISALTQEQGRMKDQDPAIYEEF
ncbi:aldo/keto reductase [Alkalihalobacillus pseudalcaliphilus]|uniref:aldo/keto reductase n=1 Tax=Alkalihalobacillus pseudalcaliphilus TaxID=79884 RepID=UPI00064D94BD|nr:aldo/keto reductase [Alkalihalobacillus pseudalcaliphilus]KMK77727.1 2,5-diketo-D-gluconic acid reductase [Alkalihalobacillus pseudalcaliphilus]